MIAVQAPWVLWVSGAAALGVVLAHLLSVGRPPELALPTTRFVPAGPLEAVSRARALRDLLLLLLRVLVVLLAGALLAARRSRGCGWHRHVHRSPRCWCSTCRIRRATPWAGARPCGRHWRTASA